MKCAALTTRTSWFATSIRLRSRHFATWSPSNTTMSGTWLAPGTELVTGSSESRGANGVTDKSEVWYLLDRAPVVTGRDLRSAVETRNTSNPGMWQVNFTLSPEAAKRFGPFTEQNIGNKMAIVLDHKVQSAPVINGRIEDTGMIEGTFSQDSAHELAL